MFYCCGSNSICILNIIYFPPQLPGCWSILCLYLAVSKQASFSVPSSLRLEVSPVHSSQPLLPPPSTTIPSHAMVGLVSCVLFSPAKNSHMSVTVFFLIMLASYQRFYYIEWKNSLLSFGRLNILVFSHVGWGKV